MKRGPVCRNRPSPRRRADSPMALLLFHRSNDPINGVGCLRKARFGWRIAAAMMIIVASPACSGGAVARQPADICRPHARTIVHDDVLWRRYVQQVQPDFIYAFRMDRTRAHEPENQIVRNDADIRLGGKLIATLINYNATYSGLGAVMTPSCTSLVPEQYIERIVRKRDTRS
jgi:hypothetical protein